jgi:hypothetical protein
VTYSRSDVFCDYLTVTCNPNSSFVSTGVGVEATLDGGLEGYFARVCLPVAFEDRVKGVVGYSAGDQGLIRIERKRRFHAVSASGGAIRFLIDNGYWRDYLNILGSVEHNVTRIDVAVDEYRDAAGLLRELESRYPDGLYSFGRKALGVTTLYRTREDGVQTGTWYVGHRTAARVSARVYDKADEALQKRGVLLPPTARYELTFRKDFKCSLWDALMPESLFYSHASPGLLAGPDRDVPVWCPKGVVPWVSDDVDCRLSTDVFERRMATSPELEKLAELALDIGGDCRSFAVRAFERQFDGLVKQIAAERALRLIEAEKAAEAEAKELVETITG